MTTRLAGVALAAMVGTCALAGGAQRAEAAVVFFDFSYPTPASAPGSVPNNSYDTFASVSGMVDVNSSLAKYSVDISSYPVYSGNIFRYLNEYTVRSKSISVDAGNDGFLNFLDISYNDGRIRFYTRSYGGTSLLTGEIYGYPNFTSDNGLAQLASDVSFVPLPASASLFAIALIALGGTGYARRRLSKPQAA